MVLPSFTGVNIVCPSKVRKAVGERAPPTALHEKLLAQRLIVRLRMALFDGIQEDTQKQRCHSDTNGIRHSGIVDDGAVSGLVVDSWPKHSLPSKK